MIEVAEHSRESLMDKKMCIEEMIQTVLES